MRARHKRSLRFMVFLIAAAALVVMLADLLGIL